MSEVRVFQPYRSLVKWERTPTLSKSTSSSFGLLSQALERRTAFRSVSSSDVAASSCDMLIRRRTIMTIGTVKWFNTQKGYGFIQPEDGSKDVFVHISAVERSGMGNLHEGQRLSFEFARGNQGKTSAVNLQQA
jgi:cold shock protein